MTITYTEACRTAFVEYLRRGTPIRLSLKQAGITDRYVWRTRRDERVRPSHRMNDGRIFSWSDPPATGHPGDDYNCRCEAVPFVAGETEFGFHEFTTSLASSYDRWSTEDFWDHYQNGNGRAVSLLEIGHLREIAEQYAYDDGIEGAFRRLADQIADEARKGGSRNFTYDFEFVYDFSSVDFAHGDGTVRGVFVGSATRNGPMMTINGSTRFEFHDIFQDPFDIGVEVGVPYRIYGDWTARFSAEVLAQREDSNFRQRLRSD